MARRCIQIKVVDSLQLPNPPQRLLLKRAEPVERVQNDALQQVAYREIVIFRESFLYFQQSLLNAHAGLDTFHNPNWRFPFLLHLTSQPNSALCAKFVM